MQIRMRQGMAAHYIYRRFIIWIYIKINYLRIFYMREVLGVNRIRCACPNLCSDSGQAKIVGSGKHTSRDKKTFWKQCYLPPPLRNTKCGNLHTLPKPMAYPIQANVNSSGFVQLPRSDSCLPFTWFSEVLRWLPLPDIMEFFCKKIKNKKNQTNIR